MTAQKWLRTLAMVTGGLVVATSALAQQNVTTSDIQRLQDQVFQASTEISRLRSTDSAAASKLETQLDELREEVIYLKVKLRKEGSVPRGEYATLRDQLQELRSRARGESTAAPSSAGAPSTAAPSTAAPSTAPPVEAAPSSRTAPQTTDERPAAQTSEGRSAIPVGQELDVRLQTQLSSDTAQVEDRFEATTITDLYRGNEVLIPAGSVMRGVVSSVKPASRTNRRGELTVAFDQITIRGRNYPMRGTVTQALQSEGIRGEAGRIGVGSAVGGILGGIIGGVRGALLGVLIGGGGTIAATEGKDVTLPPGTVLRVRLDTPPNVG